MKSRVLQAAKAVGLDSAIFFSVSAKLWQASAGIITLVLITHFLSAPQQGFYYSFASIIALQVFFELGFSAVIVQFISHEMAALGWTKETKIDGNEPQKSRFFSLARLAIFWYGAVAVLMIFAVMPAGLFFFRSDAQLNESWHGAWIFLVVFAALHIGSTSVLILLEGTGKIKEVAKIRLVQSIVASVAAWLCITSGFGLYALGAAYAGQLAVTATKLISTYVPFIKDTLKRRPAKDHVRWTVEILPLQWRLALSWISGYFISQALVPLTFHYQGAVEAGKIGLAISVTTTVSALALAWITTKIPLFGKLIAEKKFDELDLMYKMAFRRSCQLLFLGSATIVIMVIIVGLSGHPLAQRIPDPLTFALLLSAAAASHIVFCQAFYLRAFKREPYLLLSIAWGIMVAIVAVFTSKFFGSRIMMLGYMLINAGLILPWSWYIFRTKKRAWAQS